MSVPAFARPRWTLAENVAASLARAAASASSRGQLMVLARSCCRAVALAADVHLGDLLPGRHPLLLGERDRQHAGAGPVARLDQHHVLHVLGADARVLVEVVGVADRVALDEGGRDPLGVAHLKGQRDHRLGNRVGGQPGQETDSGQPHSPAIHRSTLAQPISEA